MNKNYTLIIKAQRSIRTTLLWLCLGILSMAGYAQTYTFTPASAAGQNGPTQTQVNNAYTSTNLNGLVVATSGIQSWTVPLAGTYEIEVSGAQGGNTTGPTSGTPYGKTGGLGARMKGTFSLAAGDVVKVLVGQKGLDAIGTGGGGGGTYVVCNNTLLIAAGGGGGPSSDMNGVNGVTVTSGTADNPASAVSVGGTGGNGGGACSGTSYNAGGGGGYNAGTAGDGVSPTGGATGGSSFLNGGTGGTGGSGSTTFGGFGGGGGANATTVGGGGGGGYSGGAGGMLGLFACASPTSSLRSGGGGGGSYNTGTNQTNQAGVQTGDGKATFTKLCNVSISGPSVLCSGSSATLTTNATGSYSWSTGNTTSSLVVVSPASTTSYTVYGTGTNPPGCYAGAAITITVSGAAPVLTVSTSTNSTCLGNTVSISASGALTYTYSGGISAGVSFTPAAGVNNYTITGANGCGSTTSVTSISISQLPITVSPSSTLICASTPATLSASGAASYTWNPGASSFTNYVVNPAVTTIYTVTGKTGSCTGQSFFTLNTKPNPTLTIVPSSSMICSGDAVTLNVNGNAVTYTWSPSGQTGTTITDNPGNIILYSVTGTNSVNCVSTAQQAVIVNALPAINTTVSNPIVCSTGASTLSASGASTYVWIGGSNATTSTMVVNPVTDANYVVTGTSSLNCSASVTVTVNVFAPTIIVTTGTAICQGASASIGAGAADTWAWSSGQTSQNITVSPSLTTVYTVTADINNLNGLSCPATNTVEVTVNPKPVIVATSNNSVICFGNSAVLSASGAGTSGTYTWTGGAGSVVSPNNTVTPIGDQTYTVNGTDANGCKGKATFFLSVSPCVGIAVNASNPVSLSVYPNPSNGEFMISSNQAITLQITNELGQQVKEISLIKDSKEIKLSHLANGIYFISGKNENGSVKQKIVIAK